VVSGGGAVCCLLSLSNRSSCAAPSAFPGRTIASYTLLDAEVSGAARGASWAGLGCAPTNCSAVRGATQAVQHRGVDEAKDKGINKQIRRKSGRPGRIWSHELVPWIALSFSIPDIVHSHHSSDHSSQL
jgi:hypothetical protein